MTDDEQKRAELTAAAIEEALQGRFPSFGDVSPCYRSSEGCHHDVWFVGHNLILRGLPATGQTNGKSELSLEKDSAVSKLLRKHMSKSNLVPEVLGRVTIGDWICNVEVRVHGTSLEETSPAEATGDDLVTLLQGLASVPIEEARMATKCEEERPNLEELVPEAIEAWGELMRCKYVDDPKKVVKRFLRCQLSQLSTLQEDEEYRPVLLHADISTEHILIDKAQGTVNGIIDWSEALTGDPCVDISGLSLTFGRNMASRISKKTSYSRLTIDRGFLFAICLVITDIRGTVCGDDEGPEELLKREFGRVFEGAGVNEVTFLK